jgi:hypothetical protein
VVGDNLRLYNVSYPSTGKYLELIRNIIIYEYELNQLPLVDKLNKYFYIFYNIILLSFFSVFVVKGDNQI